MAVCVAVDLDQMWGIGFVYVWMNVLYVSRIFCITLVPVKREKHDLCRRTRLLILPRDVLNSLKREISQTQSPAASGHRLDAGVLVQWAKCPEFVALREGRVSIHAR